MDKFTGNFPRAVIENRFPLELTERDWLISINDAGGIAPQPANNFSRVHTFFFDDDNDPTAPGSMKLNDAIVMARFINQARQANKNLWVHCTAGICRSGAVVEVLSLLGWTIVTDFSPQRVPNIHVFSMLRQQFSELSQSWDNVILEKSSNFYFDWIKSIDAEEDRDEN